MTTDAMREALKDTIELLESYSFSRGIDPRNATPASVIGKGRAALSAKTDRDVVTENELTRLMDEAWPDGHRAMARKILETFTILKSQAQEGPKP